MGSALVAIPRILRNLVLIHRWIYTRKMERSRASVATQKLSRAVTHTAEVVVFLARLGLVSNDSWAKLKGKGIDRNLVAAKLTDMHSEALRAPRELDSAVGFPARTNGPVLIFIGLVHGKIQRQPRNEVS